MDKLINDFSFGLFFFQVVVIVILILILKKYAWGPILDAINKREDGIRESLESAEKARIEMDNLQSDHKKLMQETREERDKILAEARKIKDKTIADASQEAEEKANTLIVNAKNAVQSEKQAALTDIKAQMAELSIGIAEKVVKKELDDKNRQIELVDELLRDVKIN